MFMVMYINNIPLPPIDRMSLFNAPLIPEIIAIQTNPKFNGLDSNLYFLWITYTAQIPKGTQAVYGDNNINKSNLSNVKHSFALTKTNDIRFSK